MNIMIKEEAPSQEQVDPTQDDPMGEDAVDHWEAEDAPDEGYVVEPSGTFFYFCIKSLAV